MSKAIEKAYEAYPLTEDNRLNHERNAKRVGFQQGYEQAEKDLELTWEDIREICRMWIESKTPFGVTGEVLSIEVLKRFKDLKK